MQPIHTALCSFGMSGHLFHAPFMDVNANFNLYGVLERTQNRAQKKYPNIKTFRTLEAMLEDDTIELVILNTPNITHYDLAKQIINSGKHVVVEKPFTATVAEAEELIKLAKDKNVYLSVYHNRRWDSDFKTVQKILNQCVLGDIVEAEFHYDRFETNLSYKTHKETPTEAVGSLYDLGSHLIDQTLQLFGMPFSVFAHMDAFRKDSKVTDYFDVKLYYKTHLVTLKSSYFVREPLPAYVLHGKKGSFVKSKSDIQETELQKGVRTNTEDWGFEPKSEQGVLHIMKDGTSHKESVVSEKGDYMAYYNGLYEAIRHHKSLPVSAEDGMKVIKIIEAATKSNNEKRIIEL